MDIPNMIKALIADQFWVPGNLQKFNLYHVF